MKKNSISFPQAAMRVAWMGLALAATPALAQLALQAFEIVLARAGVSCDAIDRTQPIGTASSGDTLVAVACKNGERQVVRIHKNNSVSYMTTCSELKTRTGIACFENQ
ncbi:hypothetical protein [Thiorhodococcus mannitoliphagus]|nr:hypothetical protein [Thiorhodococcus mannitoliphagus]